MVMTRLRNYSLAELEHLFLEFFMELNAVRPLLPCNVSLVAAFLIADDHVCLIRLHAHLKG